MVCGMKDCYVSERLSPELMHEKEIRETKEAKYLNKKYEKLCDLADSRGNTTYIII